MSDLDIPRRGAAAAGPVFVDGYRADRGPAIRRCTLCRAPIATGDCPHVVIEGGRVTMSETEWRRLAEELARLRTLEGEAGA